MENDMTKEVALKILERHNEWRRGKEIPMLKPKLIGLAIEKAIEVLRLSIVSDAVCIFCYEEKRQENSFLCSTCIDMYNEEKQTER